MRDWDSLRYILAIEREGGLSGAARALGVNHATVSRQLAKAEAAVGTALFTRLATGLVPTTAGKEAARRASMIETELLKMDLALAARDERETGALTITAAPLVVESGLHRDIAAFHELHPGIHLTLLGDNRILNLHRREADVAIRVERSPTDTLWGRVIARQRAGWFASSTFVSRYFGSDETCAPVPIVSFTHWRKPVPDDLSARFPDAKVALVVDDMSSAAAVARAGMAMVRMPLFLGAGDPALMRVPNLPLIEYAPIWALTHPDLRRAPRVEDFLRFVAGRFGMRKKMYYGEEG